jgi:hypothetical protein
MTLYINKIHVSTKGLNSVVVLSYSQYVRLRTVLKRLEGTEEIDDWLSNPAVLAIGGLNIGPNSRILYTKEVIECPELELHELLCNHLGMRFKVLSTSFVSLSVKYNIHLICSNLICISSVPKKTIKGKRRKKKVRNPSQGSNSYSNDSISGESDESEKVKGVSAPLFSFENRLYC